MLRTFTRCFLAVGVVCLLTAIASAQVTYPVSDVLRVNYFINAHGGGDGKVRLLNPGLFESGTGLLPRPGNLCALIYVLDRGQQLLECCGCALTPNGGLELDVDDDLTDNSLTGGNIYDGDIKIVSHPVPASGDCNSASTSITNPRPTLRAWITNPQSTWNGPVLTETEFADVRLSASEVRRLQSRCRFIVQNASGHGICTCGNGG